MFGSLLTSSDVAGPISDTVALSGTTSVPNTVSDFAIFPATAEAGWRFNLDGSVDKNGGGTYTQFNKYTEWVSPKSPATTYYIRATNYSGSNPDSGTLGSWDALTTTREWKWVRSAYGLTSGTLKVEIATDAGGASIVATGYYNASVEVDTGS